MTILKTLLVAALLSTTVYSGVRAADATTTTTTYRSTTYTQNYYNFNPFSKGTTGLYVAGQAGGSFPLDDQDDSGVYALTVGWQFHPLVRAEIEGAYRNNDNENVGGDSRTNTAFLNGYFDFRNDTRFTPYLGAGAGWAWNKLDAPGVSESESAFAFQGIAGVSYNIDNNWALTADYRYVGTLNFDYSAAGVLNNYDAHEVRGGVRYTF